MDYFDAEGLRVVSDSRWQNWVEQSWWTPKWRTLGQHLELRRAKYRRMIERMRRAPTRREHQVLNLIMVGKRNREIAKELGISTSVVKNMVSRMYDLYGVRNRIELFLKVQEKEATARTAPTRPDLWPHLALSPIKV